MAKTITIDTGKCIHCGMCVKDCFLGCLEFDENKNPRFNAQGADQCVGCQHCLSICPTGALTFCDKKPENSAKVTLGNSEDLLGIIKSRRSIRAYKNQDIPQEKFDKIKEMLAYAPTGVNADSLHFSIVESKDKMDEIRKLTHEKILADTNAANDMIWAFCQNGIKNGLDIVYRGAPSMVAVSVDKSKAAAGCENIDPIIALSYLDLYAHSLGLGTLWCDIAFFAAEKYPEVMQALQIPAGFELNFIMLLGIPAVKYQRTPQPEAFRMSIVK